MFIYGATDDLYQKTACFSKNRDYFFFIRSIRLSTVCKFHKVMVYTKRSPAYSHYQSWAGSKVKVELLEKPSQWACYCQPWIEGGGVGAQADWKEDLSAVRVQSPWI